MSEVHPFQKRIKYKGGLEELLKPVSTDFDFGEYVGHEVVGVGYEDFNIILETNKGKYFVKCLADFRSDEDCQRYLDIILAVVKNGVRHPKLYKSTQGYLHKVKTTDGLVRLIVLEYVEGETYFNLKRKPNARERDFLVSQAALINSINIKPSFVYDSWAVVNFLKEYNEVKPRLESADVKLIQPVADEFSKLDIPALPHCFVHGDIIDTNVLKSRNGDVFILDFSVSNYYPRIQELAVMLCNILFDPLKLNSFMDVYRRAIEVYQQRIRLTDIELEALPTYIRAAHAMHFIGSTKAIVEFGDSEENTHWRQAGRVGLRLTSELL